MSLRDLFSHSVSYRPIATIAKAGPTPAADEAQKPQAPGDRVGSLVSPDSLATFSGGSVAILVVWTVIERILELPHNLLLGAAISLVFGATLLWSDLTDPDRALRPSTPKRVLAAVINTFILFNAASGAFNIAATPATAESPPSPPAATAPTPPK